MRQFLQELGKIKGAIVVGAADGIDYPYLKRHTNYGLYFEPVPKSFHKLKEKLKTKSPEEDVHCYNYGLLDKEGIFSFWQGLELQNSSFLELNEKRPKIHRQNIHDIVIEVKTTTLDTFFKTHPQHKCNNYNLLLLDCQGTELLVLKGAKKTLNNIDTIIIELSYFEIYKGTPLAVEVDNFLKQCGFTKIKEIPFVMCQSDALYIKKIL